MAINYTPEFNKEIRRILSNYNKKISRIQAKNPKARNIPPKITSAGLKSAYQNRGDLIRKLKQLESFSQEKMKKTVSVSSANYKVNQYKYDSYLLNKKVAKQKISHLLELNQKKDKKEGRFLPSHRTRSLKANLKTLNSTDKNKYSLSSLLSSMKIASRYSEGREESDRQFYENFFDMLWANQVYADIDEDLVQQAHDMFEKLTPEQLLELYNSEPDVQRLVEDYNLYIDTQGYSMTDEEAVRARVRFEMIMDELPELIAKYSKL